MSKSVQTETRRETTFRIEERFVTDGTVAHAWSLTGDTADEAQYLFDRLVAEHPHRYTPYNARRLVLLAVGGAR